MAKEFNKLQSKHSDLVFRYGEDRSSDELLNAVKEYIGLVRVTSQKISDGKERNQLEKILQFWAVFIYDKTGNYPETKLLPIDTSFVAKRILTIVIVIGFLSLAAWYSKIATVPFLKSEVQTQFVESLTAAVPTPTPTPDPIENTLLTILNSNLTNTNQLSQVLEVRYYVLKVKFLVNNSQVPEQFFVEVHCECVNNTPCCSVNRTFVALTDSMKSDSVLFSQIVPLSITTLQVSCYDHEKPTGTISVPWYLMVEYFNGAINGFQLGGEIIKSSTPMP